MNNKIVINKDKVKYFYSTFNDKSLKRHFKEENSVIIFNNPEDNKEYIFEFREANFKNYNQEQFVLYNSTLGYKILEYFIEADKEWQIRFVNEVFDFSLDKFYSDDYHVIYEDGSFVEEILISEKSVASDSDRTLIVFRDGGYVYYKENGIPIYPSKKLYLIGKHLTNLVENEENEEVPEWF